MIAVIHRRYPMKKHVLVVAHQLELRAKLGGLLQSAGYAVDLAADEKRALHLVAADAAIEAAIVVPSSGSVDWKLAQELHDTVPIIIVLADRADDVARRARLLPQTDALLSQPLNEQELLAALLNRYPTDARTTRLARDFAHRGGAANRSCRQRFLCFRWTGGTR
jgi:DNA-binding response OmpR family regulator